MLISPPFSTFLPVPSFPFHPPSSSSTSSQFVSPTRVTRCLSLTHTHTHTHTHTTFSDRHKRSQWGKASGVNARLPVSLLCTDQLVDPCCLTEWWGNTAYTRTQTHTNTEPHTPSNAGANVTLQILSFPLSCSWSVRRVWHSEGIDSRGRFTLALTHRLAFKYMHTGPTHTHTHTHPLVAWDVVQILLNDPEPIPATEPGVFCSSMVSGTFRSQVIMRS